MNGLKKGATRITSLVLLMAMLLGISAQAAQPAPPSITAQAAVVMDYDTGEVLYEKDPDTLRVPASMTKVMTAYIIFEELEAGRLTLSTLVPVGEKNARISRNSAYPTAVPLQAGSKLSVETLLKLILVPSASASCLVMAEYISGSEAAFVQRMNETAKRLGMNTAYQNCHGAKPHYITARSQAILTRAFIQRFPQILNYTSLTSVEFNGKKYANTNKLLPGSQYAYAGADGFKTGTIAEAGYCLAATAVRGGHRLISVVMHSKNTEARHKDSIALLDYGFERLALKAPYQDVAGHFCQKAVEQLKDLGAELHIENEQFRPKDAITHAEFTAMLFSAMEKKGIAPDALKFGGSSNARVAGHWAENYLMQAAQYEVLPNGAYYNPDAALTRQTMIVMLDQLFKLPQENGLNFTDIDTIDVDALRAAARVTAAGWVRGNQGKLYAKGICSRGEAAVVVARVLESK